MRNILLLIAIVCSVLTVHAQNTEVNYRAIYDAAEEDYRIGRFEEAEQALLTHQKKFSPQLHQSVYRLLALCKISTDDEEGAEDYVRQLLRENPYYSPTLDDHPRFIDMVERIKSGLSATITTASSQAENLNEVPVPTTLITEEMIHNCGGRNLQEVLAALVPGMSIVDCNTDPNIAMRGIYSNSQEKILIMLNGHRLNSFCTNIASPDFSMSLEKIKQIEVLRGPASSLYGGVALTAVINIITKQGADVDGIKMRAGGGDHNTFYGDILWGKRYFDLDVLIWGSIYKSKGQRYHVDYDDGDENILVNRIPGDITVGGFGDKPSYDMGINMKWRNLQFLYNTRFSQAMSPFTMTYMYMPYNYDKYSTYNGIKPSYATQTHHVDLGYGQQLGKLFLKGSVTYDNNDLTHYQVITDGMSPLLGILLKLPAEIALELADKEGLSRYINGQEQTLGIHLKSDLSYVNNKNHKGSLSFGIDFSHFSLEDCRYVIGHSFTDRLHENNKISEIGKGTENSYDSFIQLKHQWRSFIFNAGLRYDHKKRYDGSDINEFSPRLALIFVQPKWNVKLSYSKAFIDAPYLYRKTNDYLSAITNVQRPHLSPESFHSYQLTFSGTQWIKGLDIEVNGFYNRARDLIYMQIIDHQNTGNTDTYGIELTANYSCKRFTANLTATWQKLSKSHVFNYEVSKSFNIPSLLSHLTLGWQATRKLKLHTHLSYASKQTAYDIDLLNAMSQVFISEASPEEREAMMEVFQPYLKRTTGTAIRLVDVSPRFLVDLGARYQIVGPLEVNVNIHNLFNKSYSQSGMATGLIPQRGRWISADVSYKF